MPTLTLDGDELRALLTDGTRQPNRFPLSPKRSAWLSALEKLTPMEEGRPKDPDLSRSWEPDIVRPS
jgi:hypothetical protein